MKSKVDLSKLSDVVKNDVVKKYVYNANIKNIEDKIPLNTNTTLNAKINKVKGELPSITNLIKNLVKKIDYNTKISEI